MTDTSYSNQGDDAPATTSKKRSEADDQALGVSHKKGDTVLGRTVTINRPRAELFEYFRDFAKLPTFMENVERIDIIDAKRSHWVVKAPAGKTVEWDAIVTEEIPGEMIAWSSAEGADIPNSGRIDFRDVAERGTTVSATITYDPPGGAVGKLIAKISQREPAIQARRDLRRFKQLMETGEISTSARTRAEAMKEKE